MPLFEEYLEKLKQRRKKNKISREFQEIGLQLAQLLGDEKHKSLYIKLAKEKNQQELLNLAKRISEMKNIENKGGYFMRVLFGNKNKNNSK
jgi:SepF-like predicted cell division protein (DUF552 family)